MPRAKNVQDIPVCEKALLTIEECTAYAGIGLRKLRELSNEPDCGFVIWVGSKKMINRKKFDEFIEASYSI